MMQQKRSVNKGFFGDLLKEYFMLSPVSFALFDSRAMQKKLNWFVPNLVEEGWEGEAEKMKKKFGADPHHLP